MSGSVSGLHAAHRAIARTETVNAALLGYHNAPALHYSEESNRWDGIEHHLDARKGQFPHYADCSSFGSWCYWNGLHLRFGVRDVVNGEDWGGGNTASMVRHGKRVVHIQNVQKADSVIYGPSESDTLHTAIVVGVVNGVPMVISNGSEAGPLYLPYNYRPDHLGFWRFI
jgi:hypothetical protein